MVKTMIILAAIFASSMSYAKEIAIFDVRRPLSFENGQDLPKDFYINAGIEVGLKVGMTVSVNRRQTLYDPFQNKSPGDLIIPVGRLRIIHVQDNIAVARLEEMSGRQNLPTLDFDAVMVGDRLDMATAKMGSGKRAENNESSNSASPTAASEGSETSASTSPAIVPQQVEEMAPVNTESAPPAPLSTTPPPVASFDATFELPTEGPTL